MGNTDFLFAQPSILEGFARILDVGGTFDEYNYSKTESEADAKALYHDFRAVGEDIITAIRIVENEQNEEL